MLNIFFWCRVELICCCVGLTRPPAPPLPCRRRCVVILRRLQKSPFSISCSVFFSRHWLFWLFLIVFCVLMNLFVCHDAHLFTEVIFSQLWCLFIVSDSYLFFPYFGFLIFLFPYCASWCSHVYKSLLYYLSVEVFFFVFCTAVLIRLLFLLYLSVRPR